MLRTGAVAIPPWSCAATWWAEANASLATARVAPGAPSQQVALAPGPWTLISGP